MRDINTSLVELRKRVEQVPSANQASLQREGTDGKDWLQEMDIGDGIMPESSILRGKSKKNSRNKKLSTNQMVATTVLRIHQMTAMRAKNRAHARGRTAKGVQTLVPRSSSTRQLI